MQERLKQKKSRVPTAEQITRYGTLRKEAINLAKQINTPYILILMMLTSLPTWIKQFLVHHNSPFYLALKKYAEPRIAESIQAYVTASLEAVREMNIFNNKHLNQQDLSTIEYYLSHHFTLDEIHNPVVLQQLTSTPLSIDSSNLLLTVSRMGVLAGLSYSYSYYLLPTLIATELSTYLVKKYTLDPLCLRLFPNGIFYSRAPLPLINSSTQLSSQAMNSAIQDLEEHIVPLKRTVRRNTVYARLLFMLYLIKLIIFDIDYKALKEIGLYENFIFPFFNPVTWSLFIMASTYLWDDLNLIYRAYRFENDIQNKLKALQTVTALLSETATWKTYRTSNLETSFFSFEGVRPYQNIKISLIIEVLKSCFIEHEIKIINDGKHHLTLPGNIRLTNNIINKLHAKFQAQINHLIQVFNNKPTFYEQINKLSLSFNVQKSISLYTNENKLINFKSQFNLSSLSEKNRECLIKLLLELYPHNKLTIEQDFIVMIGYQLADQAQFLSLIKPMLASANPIPESASYISNYEKKNLKNKNRKISAPSNNDELQQKPELSKQLTIKWSKKFTFNNKDKEANVFELKVPSLPRYTFFACFTADENNLNVINKFKGIVQDGNVTSGKAKQGIVPANCYAKDQNGNWFFAEYKSKALGELGDARAYAKKVGTVTVDGKPRTLFDFCVIKMKTH